jgi:hypothetical protein
MGPRSSGKWKDDGYDVIAYGVVVGRNGGIAFML